MATWKWVSGDKLKLLSKWIDLYKVIVDYKFKLISFGSEILAVLRQLLCTAETQTEAPLFFLPQQKGKKLNVQGTFIFNQHYQLHLNDNI